MKLDCDAVNAAIDERLKVYEKFNKLAKQAGRTRCCSFSFGWILLVLSIACISVNYYEIHPKIKEGVSMIENFTGRPNSMGQIGYVAGGIALFLFFVAMICFSSPSKKFDKEMLESLKTKQQTLEKVRSLRSDLYKQFLKGSVDDEVEEELKSASSVTDNSRKRVARSSFSARD
eukprot:GHVL01009255.1.p2 GENE.GHVL01009255.1~~GHVL01009255.1.p2  ORF type:complete len:174 (-),score=28.75 GHVL01009255.1:872-1393(-)